HIQDVVGVQLLARAVNGGAKLLPCGDDAFGDQEPGGQLHVMPGGTHGHGERLPAHADLQWLLDGEHILAHAHLGCCLVFVGSAVSQGDLLHLTARGDPPHTTRLHRPQRPCGGGPCPYTGGGGHSGPAGGICPRHDGGAWRCQ